MLRETNESRLPVNTRAPNPALPARERNASAGSGGRAATIRTIAASRSDETSCTTIAQ